jgi:hypothetical protein
MQRLAHTPTVPREREVARKGGAVESCKGIEDILVMVWAFAEERFDHLIRV